MYWYSQSKKMDGYHMARLWAVSEKGAKPKKARVE